MPADVMSAWAGDDPRLCAVPIYAAAPIGLNAEFRALNSALNRATDSSGTDARLINLRGRPLDGRSHLLSAFAFGAGALPYDWYWLASFHGAAICGRTLRPDLRKAALGMERPSQQALETVREAPRSAIVVIREGDISSDAILAHLISRPMDVVMLLGKRAGLMMAGSADIAFPARVEAPPGDSFLRSRGFTETDAKRLYERLGGSGAALRLFRGAGLSPPASLGEALSLLPGSYGQLVQLASATIRATCSPGDPLAAALATIAACGDTVVPAGFAKRLLRSQDIILDGTLLARLANAFVGRGLGTLVPVESFRLEPHVREAIVSSPELGPLVACAREALVDSAPRTYDEADSMNVDETVARWSAYEEMLNQDPEKFRDPAALQLADVLAARRELNRARSLYANVMRRALGANFIQGPDLDTAMISIIGFASAAFESDEVDNAFERLLLFRSTYSRLLETLSDAPPDRVPEGFEDAAKSVRDALKFTLLRGLVWVNMLSARGLRLAGRYADAEAVIGRELIGFKDDYRLGEEIGLEKAKLALERNDPSAAYAHLRKLKLVDRTESESETRAAFEVRAVRALALALSGDSMGIADLETQAAAATGVAEVIAETCLATALVGTGRYEQAAPVVADAEQKARDLFGRRSRRHLSVRRTRLALQLATNHPDAASTAGKCILEAMTLLHDAHPDLVDLRRTLWRVIDRG